MFSKIVTILYLIIGIYFTYTGIAKKGRLYENPIIDENMVFQFKRDMSLFLKLSGPVLCAGALFELIGLNPLLYAGCYLIVIMMATILMFRMRKYTKKV